ncbi:Uncharacterised protein [Mycobacterium tuberculosis]|nr:Uncharacterised protein [Mycobacterium tuberculosis]
MTAHLVQNDCRVLLHFIQALLQRPSKDFVLAHILTAKAVDA